jgi:hypothetical protein
MPASRAWQIQFVNVDRPTTVTINGRRVPTGEAQRLDNWSYDAATHTLHVNTGEVVTSATVTIRSFTAHCASRFRHQQP